MKNILQEISRLQYEIIKSDDVKIHGKNLNKIKKLITIERYSLDGNYFDVCPECNNEWELNEIKNIKDNSYYCAKCNLYCDNQYCSVLKNFEPYKVYFSTTGTCIIRYHFQELIFKEGLIKYSVTKKRINNIVKLKVFD